MSNKYAAKGFWYHIASKHKITDGSVPAKAIRGDYHYFCSQLEWDVYQLLLDHFPEQTIDKDFSVALAKGTTNKFKVLIEYRIDFVVRRPKREKPIYIESKGYLTAVSRMKLQLLGINYPEIAENTHLVYRDAVKIIADCPVNYHSFKGFEEWLNLNY